MPVTVLSTLEKANIYRLWMDGATKSSLAKDYDVSTRTIGRVIEELEEEDLQTSDVSFYYDKEEGLDLEEWDDNHDDWEDEYEEEYDDYELSYDEGLELTKEEYFVVASGSTINITKLVNGDLVGQVGIDNDNAKFEEVSDLVWSNRGSQDSLAQAYGLLDRKTFIEKYSNGLITVDPEAGRVFYKVGNQEQDFAGQLVPRLISALEDGGETGEKFLGLVSFAERLTKNPSYRAVNELYNFLEAACIDIDENGYVIAFKKVRGDYTDIYSGKFDNSPGRVCEVPRNMVDEDSNRTCSYGLHVCSSSYLPYFGSCSGNRVVKVKVDPADFVAVPGDYNDAKARVSKYEVLSDDDWMLA